VKVATNDTPRPSLGRNSVQRPARIKPAWSDTGKGGFYMKPTSPGFYWAKVGKGNWFIVQVGGEAPFLSVVDYLPKSVNWSEVKNLKWGGEVERPFEEGK